MKKKKELPPQCCDGDMIVVKNKYRTWKCLNCGNVTRRTSNLQLYCEMISSYDQLLSETDSPKGKKIIKKLRKETEDRCKKMKELEQCGVIFSDIEETIYYEK
jgi:predicted RNA-binding Zn-ribbon protein involved in translation (DUF1610 family)